MLLRVHWQNAKLFRTSVGTPRYLQTMNRPRNHQQRPPRDQPRSGPRSAPRAGNSNIPTVQQVTPGASVSIVLKEDQRTGREVQGLVKDLLTRGDHPRGIKVRLQDGRIGRVQRMAAGIQSNAANAPQVPSRDLRPTKDVQEDSYYANEPPSRSLADYIPSLNGHTDAAPSNRSKATFNTATVTCPICGQFEGDETAVSHHVEQHLE